jgi:hypothetical protein
MDGKSYSKPRFETMSKNSAKPATGPQPTPAPRPAPEPKRPGALVIARPPHPQLAPLFSFLVVILVLTGGAAAQSSDDRADGRFAVPHIGLQPTVSVLLRF